MIEIKKELEKRKKIIGSIQKVVKRIEKNEVKNIWATERDLQKLESLVQKVEDDRLKEALKDYLNELREKIKVRKEEVRFSLAKEIENVLRSRGIYVAPQGSNIRIGPYLLQLDFMKGRASLYLGYEKVRENIRLNLEEIVKQIEKIERELKGGFEPQKFVDIVFEAYKRILRIKGEKMEAKIPVIDVLREYVFLSQPSSFVRDPKKENFRGYGRAFFGYHLYLLRKSGKKARGRFKLCLVTSTFDRTRRRENFIWVPDNERGDGTTYSLLYFIESK